MYLLTMGDVPALNYLSLPKANLQSTYVSTKLRSYCPLHTIITTVLQISRGKEFASVEPRDPATRMQPQFSPSIPKDTEFVH